MKCPICEASIVRIGFYKVNVNFDVSEDDKISLRGIEPSQYHIRLVCAEGHSGWEDWATKTCDEELKIRLSELPDKIAKQFLRT